MRTSLDRYLRGLRSERAEANGGLVLLFLRCGNGNGNLRTVFPGVGSLVGREMPFQSKQPIACMRLKRQSNIA